MKSWSLTTPKVERALRTAIRLERQCDRNHPRSRAQAAGNGRRTILKERADHFASRGELQRRSQARKNRIDVGPRHRELGRPQVVHRVTEGVYAVAVDMRNRPGGANLEVAVQKTNTDCVTWLQRSLVGHLADGRSAGTSASRNEALIAECRAKQPRDVRLESRHDKWGRDRAQKGSDSITRKAGSADADEAGIARPFGERPVPVQCPSERCDQVLVGQRKIQLNAGSTRTRVREARGICHFCDWSDASDRFFGKGTECVGHCADQTSIDVDRTAAHPGDDASVRQWATFQARKDQVSACADHVLDHAENPGAKFLDSRPIEHGPAHSHHSGTDLVHAHVGRGGFEEPGEGKSDDQKSEGESA